MNFAFRPWLSSFLAAAAILAAACATEEALPQGPEDTDGAARVDSGPRTGEQIFAMTCASCHGAGGEGADNWMVRGDDGRLPPPPLDGDGHTWHHSDNVLYGIVSEGGLGLGFGSNMPAFKDELTHEEIIAVLEYVKTLWEGKEIDGISIAQHQNEFSSTDPYPDAGG